MCFPGLLDGCEGEMWRKWGVCLRKGLHTGPIDLNRNVHLGSDKLISQYVCLGML